MDSGNNWETLMEPVSRAAFFRNSLLLSDISKSNAECSGPDYEMIKSLAGHQIGDRAQRREHQHGIKEITAKALVPLLQQGRREGVFAIQTKLIHNNILLG